MQDAQTRRKEIWLEIVGQDAADGPYVVEPTTTVRELLAAAGLQGWRLKAPGDRNFAYEDLLFDRVADKQRLRVANVDSQEALDAELEAADASELPADAVWRQRRLE
jgi:hypothetical protein